MSFTPQDICFLSSHYQEILEFDTTLTLGKNTMLQDSSVLRKKFGDRGRAVSEFLLARRSGVSGEKFPGDWLACQESAQQATAMPVAKIRANRIKEWADAGSVVHDVTCSIGSEGAALAGVGLPYLGSDIDYSRCLMARYNLSTCFNTPQILQADALSPCSMANIIVADPARRQSGRRINSPENLIPPLPELLSTYPEKELAIKCAPGLDFSFWDGLVSLISLNGGVKEACLYTQGLSGGVRREAVVIRKGNIDRIDDRLADNPEDNLSGEPGAWIIDPDGAIIRAGLVRHYAVREGLWMLDERIAYLTGDDLPAGESGFRFLTQCPIKKVRSELQRRGCGRVEILCRGVDINPDSFRRTLKLSGPHALSLILTRIGTRAVALICGPRQWKTAPRDREDNSGLEC
ncbi:SAM-dependent methyltransferase [Corynebacterium sp. 3HC-13]|uniref:THUMP-like domain-containing protein n=1 Tax=Corynebacterium poyangense TaxID=2684405 RepID=UPI001CCDE782|nr:SAM-dependent methyltransferase [Corynebacterium poyangense]MBZ8177098.1 SAM-dependent methyltransferase [Corynebacterium poyangense]